MRKVPSAGGIVIQDGQILLIRKSSGRFALPKGHVEATEMPEQAALREVEEETGYKVRILNYAGHFSRPSTEKTGEIVMKVIDMYFMVIKGSSTIKPDEERQWVDLNKAMEQMEYPPEAAFLKTLDLE